MDDARAKAMTISFEDFKRRKSEPIPLINSDDYRVSPLTKGQLALQDEKAFNELNQSRELGGQPPVSRYEYELNRYKTGEVTVEPTVHRAIITNPEGTEEMIYLTRGQVTGRQALPDELFLASGVIDADRNVNMDSQLDLGRKRQSEEYPELLNNSVERASKKISPVELNLRFREMNERMSNPEHPFNQDVEYNFDTDEFSSTPNGEGLGIVQTYRKAFDQHLTPGRDLRNYEIDGTSKSYGYNPHGGHNLLNPDTREWESFPESRKGGSFEPSGHSYYQDREAIQSDLDVFGPDPDSGLPQNNRNQHLVDQMEGLPKHLNSMYGVDPVQTEPEPEPEPEPIPQQQLAGMAGGGMQSPPPGMVTGQPQEPMTLSQYAELHQSSEPPMEFDQIGYGVERGGQHYNQFNDGKATPQQPQQFNPADVQYGNGGEPAPKRSREENEWGYFYE